MSGKIEASCWRSLPSFMKGLESQTACSPHAAVSQHEVSEVIKETSNRTRVAEGQTMYHPLYPNDIVPLQILKNIEL